LRSLGGPFQITADGLIAPSTKGEFKVSEDSRQKIVEVMRDPSGHLTDNFHLLGLLERGLNLSPLRDLLPEFFIRLHELMRSLPYDLFQMGRRRISVKQVLLYLILSSAGAQSRLYRADKRHSIQGSLK
jgi:hypothetical protein